MEKKRKTKKLRVCPENIQNINSQGFSVSRIISNKGVTIDTTDEAFSGGIIIDLS